MPANNASLAKSQDVECEVVVVGAGPAGATTAAYLAGLGLDVVLLEKSKFPRGKVCGDGLTPRAVKQLVNLGIDISDEQAWVRNYGLRVYGGQVEPFELPWPDLAEFPSFGLVKARRDFDEILVQKAVSNGARFFDGVNVTEPIKDGERVIGVKAGTQIFKAPIVVAADGNSSRLAVALGFEKNAKRPMGVAIRAYYKSPRSDDDYMESWLELWDGKPGKSNLLPGYGWVFGMGDGTCNVGLGMLSTSAAFGKVNYRDLLHAWLANTPKEWGFQIENESDLGSAALPMSFNRKPAYRDGVLLVGDSGGMISPFNGEGIAYAMEAGSFAAEAIADAKARGFGSASAERALQGYPSRLKNEWGGYFRLGNAFASLIGHPEIMRLCTRYGLPQKTLMRFTMKLLAHLYDASNGDWMDRVIVSLTRVVPSA